MRGGRVSVTRPVYEGLPTAFSGRQEHGGEPVEPEQSSERAAPHVVERHAPGPRRWWARRHARRRRSPTARGSSGAGRPTPTSSGTGRPTARAAFAASMTAVRSVGLRSSTSRTRYGPAPGACLRSHATIPHGEVPSACGQNFVDSCAPGAAARRNGRRTRPRSRSPRGDRGALAVELPRLGGIGPRGERDEHGAAARGAVDLVELGAAAGLQAEPVVDQRRAPARQRPHRGHLRHRAAALAAAEQHLRPPAPAEQRPHDTGSCHQPATPKRIEPSNNASAIHDGDA